MRVIAYLDYERAEWTVVSSMTKLVHAKCEMMGDKERQCQFVLVAR